MTAPASNNNNRPMCEGVFIAGNCVVVMLKLFASRKKWNRLTGMLLIKSGSGSQNVIQAQSSLETLMLGLISGKGVVENVLSKTQ